MIKEIYRKILVVVVVISPGSTQAATYEGGSFAVAALRVAENNVYIKFSPALGVCQGGDNWGEHAKLYIGGDASQEIYSALLSAYAAGMKLDGVWYDEFTGPCAINDVIPQLRQIRFETKQ